MTAAKTPFQVFDTVIDQPISPVLTVQSHAKRYVETSPHGPENTEIRDVDVPDVDGDG